jgi:hypothetical protein
MKNHFTVFLFILALAGNPAMAGSLGAQEKPRIRFMPLAAEGFNDEEIRSIEYLISSYLADIGVVSTEDAQYTLSGRLGVAGNERTLELEITRGDTGERYNYEYTFKNSGELVLKARSLLSTAFQGEGRKTVGDVGERLSPAAVSGTWRGGGTEQMIRLERDGKGMIVFSSGAAMRLRYSIEDNILKVEQDSPNNERYYYPMPLPVARKLAQSAEPMRWELLLFDGGSSLRGLRFFTGADYEGETLTGLLPEQAAEAGWRKTR